jgi:hypothetical protein
MDELFYFPSFDLLIRITYTKETNSLRYATHRPIAFDERKVIDRFILHDVGPKTEFYNSNPSLMLYMGVDLSLKKELRFYRLHDTIKDVLKQKSVVDEQVKDVITKSLSAYYFDRIGDELVRLRKMIDFDTSEDQVEVVLGRIDTLVQAYNENAGENVDIENILPREAIPRYHQLHGH